MSPENSSAQSKCYSTKPACRRACWVTCMSSGTWQTEVVTSPDGRRDSRTSTEQSFQVREILESASRSSVSSLWNRITNPFSSTGATREPHGDTWRSASRTHSIVGIELGPCDRRGVPRASVPWATTNNRKYASRESRRNRT